MRSQLITCIGVNLISILLSAGFMYLFPRDSGFTFTSSNGTRFIQGGTTLAAVLMIVVNILIAVYLAFRLGAVAIRH
ncbi:MAG: hypothetical protein JOZ33_17625 [Acidobacteriaceae bacterium]|nr:hypothetical protein [Acidobacteriaceae bacterium]